MDTQNDGNALKNCREGRENAKKSVKNIDRRKWYKQCDSIECDRHSLSVNDEILIALITHISHAFRTHTKDTPLKVGWKQIESDKLIKTASGQSWREIMREIGGGKPEKNWIFEQTNMFEWHFMCIYTHFFVISTKRNFYPKTFKLVKLVKKFLFFTNPSLHSTLETKFKWEMENGSGVISYYYGYELTIFYISWFVAIVFKIRRELLAFYDKWQVSNKLIICESTIANGKDVVAPMDFAEKMLTFDSKIRKTVQEFAKNKIPSSGNESAMQNKC